MTIAPVSRLVRTQAPQMQAFEIFTTQMGRWWPRGRTVAPEPHEDIVIEPVVGGRWFERDGAGRETLWGKVLAWEPPERVLLAWQLGPDRQYDPNLVTEVEIRFSPLADGGTEVRLEHRNLERCRRDRDRWIAAIAEGWAIMLDKFQEVVEAAHGETLDAP
jgi:uncharacterized protein YndB with AHSA1/START domain